MQPPTDKVPGAVIEVVRTGLPEHPAMKAWAELKPRARTPGSIARLLVNAAVHRAVYRLEGAGQAGSSVIAKRQDRSAAAVERIIYERLLPRMPIPTLRYYGCIEEPDTGACWLFLEDAGGEQYSPSVEEHRALVAPWLGTIHTTGLSPDVAAHLPDRGPDLYHRHLQSARETVVRSIDNPALGTDDANILRIVVSQLELVESRWDSVKAFCARMPRAFVHGAFNRWNMRVRRSRAGSALLVFDWNEAGLGVPSADLASCPDINGYWSAVRSSWPRVDLAAVRHLAAVGTLFDLVAGVSWTSCRLADEWVEEPMWSMRYYQAALVHAIQAMGWPA